MENSLAKPMVALFCAIITITVAAPDVSAQAQYPGKPVRVIVPSAAGGGPDTNTRVVTGQLSAQLGQQCVVDNRPGGAGTIGMELIAKSAPDGYTVGYGNATTLAFNRFLMKLPYDAERDFRLIAQTTNTYNVISVTVSLPVKSVQELIDYAKKNPGKLAFGSSGNASSGHIVCELFQAATGTRMVHVPYKGSPQSIIDLIGGQVQLTFDPVATISQHVKTGKVRGLAVTGPRRSTSLPQLPTAIESGVPGFAYTIWGGIVAPAATPQAIVTKLNAEINKALSSPAVLEKFAALGYEPAGGTPEEFASLPRIEVARSGDIIKRSGAKAE